MRDPGMWSYGGERAEVALSSVDCAAVESAALRAGFDKAGVAAVPLAGSAEEMLQRERFTAWVESGRAGEMEWLARRDERGELLRSSLHRAVPWVRSVVICAKNYNADAPYSIGSQVQVRSEAGFGSRGEAHSMPPADPGAGWIARYAWSGAADAGESTKLTSTDYHDVLLRRLLEVEAVLHERHPGVVQTRCYVDTGPVVERYLAQLAGVGWIGKNTCVLNQELGSWMLLGVVLLSLPLAREVRLEPAADRCGSCTRCIDACPTGALVAPREMDASRCISYLTIEKKGSVPEALRAGMGRQVFGCDICQDVCPWNRRAPVSVDPEMQMRPELVNPELEWLAEMNAAAFKQEFRGSPLERTGRRRMQRNVAIAMGNSGDPAHLNRLRKWEAGEDAMLAEAAAWAIGRIESR